MKKVHALLLTVLITLPTVFSGEPAEKETVDEQTVRQRFLIAHQTAEKPERRAETVDMLRGLKERESHRLLSGMLGDRLELVRLRACAAISQTPDAEGYFVKPLMGALADPKPEVRVAAAEALANASIKADAVKALVFDLMNVVGQLSAEDMKRQPPVVAAYDKALQKLSGQKSPDPLPRALSSYWMDYWKKNETALREADAKLLGPEPPATREGLAKDSFDKPDDKGTAPPKK